MIETDDFLADLEAHLRAAASREPRRRRPRARPALVLIAALGIVAVVITAIPRSRDEVPAATPVAPATARALAERAVRQTTRVRACRPATPGALTLVDGAPLPAITAALPALATATGDPDAVAASVGSRLGGGRALRSTVRRLDFAGGVSAIVYVKLGASQQVADPAACLAARNQRVDGSAAALAALAMRLDTATDTQSLNILYTTGERSSGGGVGLPVRPGARVPTGIVGFGGTHTGGRAYVGITGAGAARVRVGAQTFPVRDGIFAFVLPAPLGHRGVEELDAGGRVLRTD